mmetsp:Transcript_104295/g.299925  ORF Transcript_104295/g.299925 Transcript_104295/m.299925 type:complete len:200 (-) Transcript_104295:870-1469(-)
MHLLTTRAPVRGRPQDCFNLCLPPLAVCSMTTSTRESDETRSMAPPMPFTILPGMIQFAKSPFAATSMAPRIVMSTCPPLIIAKESAEEKVEEPGIIVMVSLPALMRSGSTSASMGYGPMPSKPFSLWSSMRMPGFVKLDTSVGNPMPRLTYMPSVRSMAALLAINSRLGSVLISPEPEETVLFSMRFSYESPLMTRCT